LLKGIWLPSIYIWNLIILLDLNQNCLRYTEACLRCLRTVFNSSYAPTNIIFQVSCM
jgi:hypothetical protein